ADWMILMFGRGIFSVKNGEEWQGEWWGMNCGIVLTLGKSQTSLDFRSLNRTFAKQNSKT
ncbi:MAG: hypothetical protein Q4E32_07940, partial [Bacteroidales bacterium]|nr:hypothetical protein [Bacteroidales bacterium]